MDEFFNELKDVIEKYASKSNQEDGAKSNQPNQKQNSETGKEDNNASTQTSEQNANPSGKVPEKQEVEEPIDKEKENLLIANKQKDERILELTNQITELKKGLSKGKTDNKSPQKQSMFSMIFKSKNK